MEFEDNAQLDASQVSDRRGMGAGRGVALGGGGLGIVGLLIALVLGVNPADLTGGGSTTATDQTTTASDLMSRCRRGADANRDADCRIVGIANSVQAYWRSALDSYQPADTVLFTGQTNTACGAATSDVGPFYCPGDALVYLDLGFFKDLQTKFGAGSVGPPAATGRDRSRARCDWSSKPTALPASGRTTPSRPVS